MRSSARVICIPNCPCGEVLSRYRPPSNARVPRDQGPPAIDRRPTTGGEGKQGGGEGGADASHMQRPLPPLSAPRPTTTRMRAARHVPRTHVSHSQTLTRTGRRSALVVVVRVRAHPVRTCDSVRLMTAAFVRIPDRTHTRLYAGMLWRRIVARILEIAIGPGAATGIDPPPPSKCGARACR